MKAAALFSGGKDSLYAVYLVGKQGIAVDHLVTGLPTLPWPSPHTENIAALKILAVSMGKELQIVDFQRKDALLEILKALEVDALVAGDVFVEAHRLGLEDVCNKAGLKLLEPLYARDATELFNEIFSSGFKALVTGVNLDFLKEEVLGFIISKETREEFLLKIGSIDPLGENGEFHTLVLECPLYSKAFKAKFLEKRIEKTIALLKVSIV